MAKRKPPKGIDFVVTSLEVPQFPGARAEEIDEVIRIAHAMTQQKLTAAIALLRRWEARGFPMGGAQLWDDTKAFLATEWGP